MRGTMLPSRMSFLPDRKRMLPLPPDPSDSTTARLSAGLFLVGHHRWLLVSVGPLPGLPYHEGAV
jgi:hypothetical protein